ncbi:MAG: hypothetical protein PHF74_01280 [Dehalococcoidales bacterium]|nr:hypothetical protein [Dehalococcoidales bacterium]
MNKYRSMVISGVLAGLLTVIALSGCSKPPAETVTLTNTERTTSTITATVSIPTTITVTSSTTITFTSTVSASGTTTTAPSTSTAITTTDPYSNFRGYLLDGYPEDIWPLYGKLAIDLCALDIQFPAYNDMGYYVNAYKVVYITDKTQTEIAAYYNSLLQTREDSSFYDAVGTIGDYYVDARWDYWSGNNIVYLYVLLPNTLNITSNPFHTDFPESLQNLYRLGDMWAEYHSCTSNPPSGTIISSKLFSHTGTYEEAIEYYRALYSDMQDYEETVTQEYNGQRTLIRGVIDDLSFSISIGVWGNPDMIQISFSKAS